MISRLLMIINGFSAEKKIDDEHAQDIFIIYKIIKSSKDGKIHTLHCSNTRSVFKKNIQEIIYDNDILFGLPPLQSCGLGIHFAKILLLNEDKTTIRKYLKENLKHQMMHRYGKYCLHYQDREGKIFFMNSSTKEIFTMELIDIALSKKLINQFDASQAFFIGFSAGLIMKNKKNYSHSISKEKELPPYLQLVK